MIDLLFVEVGAVLTEILGRNRCTFEPFCNVAKEPTYRPENRVEADFTRSLSYVLENAGWVRPVWLAALRALYDQDSSVVGRNSASIGPQWPGGSDVGIVRIRQDVVNANATLAAAAATLPGQPWEYQVVVSIDEQTGEVRRYHGFHAEVVEDEGSTLLLRVANAGTSANPSWRETMARRVRYDPDDTKMFYRGALVEGSVVRSGLDPRGAGSVFINLETATSIYDLSLPKLPPTGGE